MEPIDHFNVMIVGAGPAGTSTWLHLQKHAPELAQSTVLIDQATFPRPKLCGGGVWPWSEKIFSRLGIDLNVPGMSISDVEFQYGEQRWLFSSPSPFRMVQRAEFDMALVVSAKKRGMVFRDNEQFIAAEHQQDAMAVTTSQGKYVVKAIIGADGSLSKVRQALMPRFASCLAQTIQVSTPVNPKFDTEFEQGRMHIDLTPVDEGLQGYIWHFPCLKDERPYMHHGIVNFPVWRHSPKVDMKKLFGRELRARCIDLPPESWSSHPIRWFSPDVPIACPNAILAGDAAGIEPALGGGIHLALSYGEIAAKALIQAFQKQNFSFQDYRQSVMSHYLGQEISDYTKLAHGMYKNENNPLELVRDFLTDRMIRSRLQNLLQGLESPAKKKKSLYEV